MGQGNRCVEGVRDPLLLLGLIVWIIKLFKNIYICLCVCVCVCIIYLATLCNMWDLSSLIRG